MNGCLNWFVCLFPAFCHNGDFANRVEETTNLRRRRDSWESSQSDVNSPTYHLPAWPRQKCAGHDTARGNQEWTTKATQGEELTIVMYYGGSRLIIQDKRMDSREKVTNRSTEGEMSSRNGKSPLHTTQHVITWSDTRGSAKPCGAIWITLVQSMSFTHGGGWNCLVLVISYEENSWSDQGHLVPSLLSRGGGRIVVIYRTKENSNQRVQWSPSQNRSAWGS